MNNTETASYPAIMIKDLGNHYANNPRSLKSDLDKLQLSAYIKESKITITNHLIFNFKDSNCQKMFVNEITQIKAFKKYRIIDLNQKQKNLIIIEELNYTTLSDYKSLINENGITNIIQMNKANSEFRMIKAECSSTEVKDNQEWFINRLFQS
jgi:hypothetical protein